MPTALSLASIQSAFPSEGLFRDKEWLFSQEPFRLPSSLWAQVQALGPLLQSFLQASNTLYRDSLAGRAPAWVAGLLDRGKPASVLDAGLLPGTESDIPEVIRPDLLLTAEGLFLSEVDSLPGGIGVLAWLNRLYARAGWPVIGGESAMLDGFSRVLGEDGRVFFSSESEGYRPEIEWLVHQIDSRPGAARRVLHEAEFDPRIHPCSRGYRFFELWDLDNVRNTPLFLQMAAEGGIRFTPPMKAFLEEKLWLALLWNAELRPEWVSLLGEQRLDALLGHVPRGWVVDPEPLPYFAEYAGLKIQHWQQLREFTQKERKLVLKISGFSETAWGSRGVHIGHDLSAQEWSAAVETALASAPRNPYVLQRFHQAKVVAHPYWDPRSGQLCQMRARARLCPYYFRNGDTVELAGILATLCPEDKKILHGMRDSILVPCIVAD